MKIFLIILAVIVVLIAVVLSLSATFTIVYDKKWSTKIKVLWIEKDIELTKILSFVLFPEKKAQEVKEKKAKSADKPKKEESKPKPEQEESKPKPETQGKSADTADEKKPQTEKPAKSKPNFLKSLWDKEGLVGIMLLVSNLLQSVSKALETLIKGFHIYSLYVKIIVGTGDSAQTAMRYGNICKYYYPLKGAVLNGMRVDNYDDLITADFLALSSEYGFQFIGSISVGALVKVLISAAKTFLVNLIKNK